MKVTHWTGKDLCSKSPAKPRKHEYNSKQDRGDPDKDLEYGLYVVLRWMDKNPHDTCYAYPWKSWCCGILSQYHRNDAHDLV